MRLERLEISGFKSFSDRAELAFDRGVTAIVGPNGCGKSNVADAITWVLGEQSAKSLRGEKMEDVIFSGSDARKPGATAEVRLRLSGLLAQANGNGYADPHNGNGNGNGHRDAHANGNGNGNGQHAASIADLAAMFTREVEVTRRLYRSGESEYLIDGETCRLRDVHELLMDTGLGAKAYAIIEQGKIGMILSSRPIDRRQLIEEAAGITKYKSRRRAAELKLEAAQQNLTRIDDVVFEVEKQRGALKRQAAKARRYRRLRDELRRWEKVLFARRYRELAETIESARSKLAAARARESAAATRVEELEANLARLRVEQSDADGRATDTRERAHACELSINRQQQQVDFNRQQAEALDARAAEITVELRDLEARRGPAHQAMELRRQAASEAEQARADAAAVLAAANDDHTRAQQEIERLEGEVETARAEVFGAINAITTLRHAVQAATAQLERLGETFGRLDVEEDDLRREREKVDAVRGVATDALARAQELLDSVKQQRSTRESQLADARADHDNRSREVRAREHDLAGMQARLASLQEIADSRADFGDAARMVLVAANGHVGQQGAVADYLEVDSRYDRAVEACLGDLLQHIIVERHAQAAAGLDLVRQHDAGRCGFVVAEPAGNGFHPPPPVHVAGITPLSEVLRVVGAHAATIAKVLPEAYVADGFEQALAFARETSAIVATLDGDVLRGPHLVSGGAKVESKGILATRREIKELRQRIDDDRTSLSTAREELRQLERTIVATSATIAGLQAEQHRLEKEIVGFEAQLARTADDSARLSRKADVVALERRRAEEEREGLVARRADAEASIGHAEQQHRDRQESLNDAQRRLAETRETVARLAASAAEARASHAALVERASALAAEVLRLEDAARELEERVSARLTELEQTRNRHTWMTEAIAEGERTLAAATSTLAQVREDLRVAEEAAARLRSEVEAQEVVIRDARRALEEVRAEASELEVARATAEGDLTHLAQSCVDTVQSTLDEVFSDVERMEQTGEVDAARAAVAAVESEPDAEESDDDVVARDGEDGVRGSQDVVSGSSRPSADEARAAALTAEDAIAALKLKIERLGPVNILAIEQFDELETRHAFLTTQRQDLIESIAQTSEAIKRIDETSKARFNDAFTAIQANFQQTFSTLFGGGRAGLRLIDENDPLETGIDIVASPPGKRLQSVQLLSGGEKALTAIALMFAIFKYKPSPFCLLDEIDAPLDDANVSRFVEMLRGMLDHTQFILITHNRRTMEIANRLYGVTMEEPGVSKLISVSLN